MTSAEKKTLVIFTDWYVPGFRAGGPIRSVHNIARLLSEDYNIKIVTRNTDYGSSEPYPGITPDEWLQVDGHEVMYLSEQNTGFKTIRKLCKASAGNSMLINGLFSFYFSILPMFLRFTDNTQVTLIAVRGMLHRSALAVKPFKKQLFIAFARGLGLFKNFTLMASSEYEKDEIQKSLGKQNIRIVPNVPEVPEATLRQRKFKANGILSIVFLGRISPEKNPIALAKALNTIKFGLSVKFIGSNIDINYSNQFESVLKNLPDNIVVERINEMPNEAVKRVLSETDVMVLPSHGENFGHAIYESFAACVPVIIGNNTPWKDIEEKKAGIEVVPDDIDAISQAIKRFNEMDDTIYREWQTGAGEAAKAYFSNNNFREQYLSILA